MPLPGCCKVSNPTSLTATTTTMRKGAAIVKRVRGRESQRAIVWVRRQWQSYKWERERESYSVHVRSVSRRICTLRFLCCCQLVRSSPILHNISNNNNNKPLSHSKHSKMRKAATPLPPLLLQHHQVRVSCVFGGQDRERTYVDADPSHTPD